MFVLDSKIIPSLMKTLLLAFTLAFLPSTFLQAQLNGKIKIYFSTPINTSVSSGTNAIYLNNSMDDTLVAYINRSKYTLDIAVYNYQQTSGMADIATAVNNATARGVVVRWIYDASQSNSGMIPLVSSVNTFGSPTTSAYGIMHNKFMIIDANSININDPIVWTGSANWTKTHFNSNVNNTIIIQDKVLAQAYLAEFNEMWGDVGITPSIANSKFGPFKSDNTIHNFTIGGSLIELYFSPTDGTNTKVLNTIQHADSDLFFGMLAFSLDSNSDSIINKKNQGINVTGIIDQSSMIYSPYTPLTSSLGANFQVYSSFTSVYHSKILITDPCTLTSDPTVITGSYNWTTPAETQNDENELIIHNDTIANIFYQSFYQNFIDVGGTILPCNLVNINETQDYYSLSIFPNPFTQSTTVELNRNLNNATLSIYNTLGKLIKQTGNINDKRINISRDELPNGVYFIHLIEQNNTLAVKKLIIADSE